jgi:nucleotide-binding universal stress UspA family protein
MHKKNPPFSRLLLATECSEFDGAAEKMAFTLAQHCQLPLAAILPMVSNPEFEALAPEVAARVDAEAAQKLVRLRQQATDANISMNVTVRRGEEAYLAIIEEARAIACDMLIIRRRGKRGFLANVLIGEMVTQVVSHTPCHVLIVPQESTTWTRCILVALDPLRDDEESLQTLVTASCIALQCGLPLRLVSVIALPSQRLAAQARIDGWTQLTVAMGVQAQGEVRIGRVCPEILQARKESASDLVIVNHPHKPLSATRWMMGSVAQQVIGQSDYPVLVLRH